MSDNYTLLHAIFVSRSVPCGLVTLPQITLILDPLTSRCALYTKATFLPR